ncbi:MAG: OmpA family protein [Bacteroidia bacterium]|nr:OmpA family protein [Bacteroidia bacterium]
MKLSRVAFFLCAALIFGSCISKKEFLSVQSDLEAANQQLALCDEKVALTERKLSTCEVAKERLESQLTSAKNATQLREEQISDLKDQIEDIRRQRDKQVEQVGDLTVLSQSANENIKETLSQLEDRDKYIKLLQAAKTKTDSINLALAINLKGVLSQGIEDEDVEIMVDKTVVFINLSDKMLYKVGSSKITPRATEVLGKIAEIIESRPDLEVMVEGYTDNLPIRNSCMEDNWDLSVKRATSVVRVLQTQYNVDPNRMIAAGRGEYNTLASNDTYEGRQMNRRTRIIIMPKIDEFYDLLNPANAPQ